MQEFMEKKLSSSCDKQPQMIKIHKQTLSTLTFPLGEWLGEQHMADVTLLNAVLAISQYTHLHGWQVQEPACC